MLTVSTPKPTTQATQTRWIHLVLGGYEPITAPDGTTSQQFILDGANIEIESGGIFGWGERDRIEAAAATRYPDRTLIDWWPISRPIAA